jgi:hypothetical protein
MNAMLKQLIYSGLRKLVFGAGAVWVAWLVKNGICTEADVTRVIEVAAAALMLAVPLLWTFVKAMLEKRVTAKDDLPVAPPV